MLWDPKYVFSYLPVPIKIHESTQHFKQEEINLNTFNAPVKNPLKIIKHNRQINKNEKWSKALSIYST
jgi:hypothetical protein